jgi:hypothetical protein
MASAAAMMPNASAGLSQSVTTRPWAPGGRLIGTATPLCLRIAETGV